MTQAALPRRSHQRPMLTSFGRLATSVPAGSGLLAFGGESVAIRHLRRQIEVMGPYFRSALILATDVAQATIIAQQLYAASGETGTVLHMSAHEVGEAVEALGLSALSAIIEERRPGAFVLSDVHQLTSAAQIAVLNLIRERVVEGDLRLIATTPHTLKTEAATGSFSPVLLKQLRTVTLSIPSFEERLPDLHLVLRAALNAFAKEKEGAHCPQLSDKEVDFVLERSRIHGLSSLDGFLRHLARSGDPIAQDEHTEFLALADQHFPVVPNASEAGITRTSSEAVPAHSFRVELSGSGELPSLQSVIDRYLVFAMTHHHGNKLRAAESLAISRSTLYRMLEQVQPQIAAESELD